MFRISRSRESCFGTSPLCCWTRWHLTRPWRPWQTHIVSGDIDLVAGIESRGFIFGVGVAQTLNLGFVPIRKPGKLPADTVREEYQLEYGTDAVEIHRDAVRPGQSVLMVDDLLATGGTMGASCRLIERLGGVVAGVVFLIELTFLNGREKLEGRDIRVEIQY